VGSETPCALVVMGVSGSGKSTIAEHLAARLGWRYVGRRPVSPRRPMSPRMSAGHPLTDEEPLAMAARDRRRDRPPRDGRHPRRRRLLGR